MNCVNHPELAAVAYCRNCGRALCQNCVRPAQGTVFCNEHVPATNPAGPASSQAPPYGNSAYTPPPGASAWRGANTFGANRYGANPYTSVPGVSPGLAFVLGLIPGVGAVYNSQYAKGLIHAVIFGIMVSIVGSGAAGGMEPLIGILISVWVFYMAFEAYHTALRRKNGEPVDEFSSILPLQHRRNDRVPVGPVVLIALGVVFLLNTLNIVRFRDILRFWPVFLIALGVYQLYVRILDRPAEIPPAGMSSGAGPESFTEVPDER